MRLSASAALSSLAWRSKDEQFAAAPPAANHKLFKDSSRKLVSEKTVLVSSRWNKKETV